MHDRIGSEGFVTRPGERVPGRGPDVKASARSTGGGLTVMHVSVEVGPLKHIHACEDESLSVFTGGLFVECGEDEFAAGPGRSSSCPDSCRTPSARWTARPRSADRDAGRDRRVLRRAARRVEARAGADAFTRIRDAYGNSAGMNRRTGADRLKQARLLARRPLGENLRLLAFELLSGDHAAVAEVGQFGELVGPAGRSGCRGLLDVLPKGLVLGLRPVAWPVRASSCRGRSDRSARRAGEDQHEQHPQRLHTPGQVGAAEDVDEHHDEEPNPQHQQEELEDRPEGVQQGVRGFSIVET